MKIQALLASAGAAAILAASGGALAQTSVEAEVIALPDWHADVYADSISVEAMFDDMDVFSPAGDDIGDVENVIFDADGKVLSIIAEIGGFFEIGDTHVNIPWEKVEMNTDWYGPVVPLTEDTIDDYSLFVGDYLTAFEAANVITEVEGDGAGKATAGFVAWRATDLIGDYARLNDADVRVNYGYVDDILIKDGQIAAVVVSPDAAWGYPGYYAYPYYGYGYGWRAYSPYYDLPYTRDEVIDLEPMDTAEMGMSSDAAATSTDTAALGADTDRAAAACSEFGMVDADDDDMLAKAEYTAWGTAVFADWDTNGDGFVSETEFDSCYQAGGWYESELGTDWATGADTLFTAWDENADAQLTQAEFAAPAAFDEWDVNDDDLVDDQEFLIDNFLF